MPKAKQTVPARRKQRFATNDEQKQASLAPQAANLSENQDNCEPTSVTFSVSAQCGQGCIAVERSIESNTIAINQLSEKIDELINIVGVSTNSRKESVPVETDNNRSESQAAIVCGIAATSSASAHAFSTTFPIGDKRDLVEFDQKLKENEFFTRVVSKAPSYWAIAAKIHVFFSRFRFWLESAAAVKASCWIMCWKPFAPETFSATTAWMALKRKSDSFIWKMCYLSCTPWCGRHLRHIKNSRERKL